MNSVESQIDLRRKEVDQWMEKCDHVETDCVQYSKALGGNIKATGSSVGELRKELVLPRRFEMVSEYQEKLRQVCDLISSRSGGQLNSATVIPHKARAIDHHYEPP